MKNNKPPKLLLQKTQIESIDKQYENIQKILNELSLRIEEVSEQEQVSQLFYKLIYLNTHYFTQEQITLAKYNYKQLEEVKDIHLLFVNTIMDSREKLNSDTLAFCNQTLKFINNWLEDYLEINKMAIDFLVSKNVK